LSTDPVIADWARSGAMALTGTPDGAPVAAPAGAARSVRDALERIARLHPGATLPDVRVLGERAAIAGLSRNAPWTVGGAGRSVRARDGWWFVSLPRGIDHDLVPALVERDRIADSWAAIDEWSASRTRTEVVERAQLIGLAAAVVPASDDPADPQTEHRGGVAIRRSKGGPRRRRDVARVVDLSALWAGPLCASLLQAVGAEVIKVESTDRPDGARRGPAEFYDLLHHGHRDVTLDFATTTGRARLLALIDDADVVIEASRPRVLEQVGVDAASATARGTVWVSITAYGRSGPWGNRIGYGDDVAAAAGLMAWVDSVPVPVGDAVADPLAGVHAAAAAVEALADGNGWLLDVSMRDVAREAACIPTEACSVEPVDDSWVVVAGGDQFAVAEPSARQVAAVTA
jgi:crotonobetainyl-CoA:carnitine CoA-transferase CaiB-like acyl-CoA transferase